MPSEGTEIIEETPATEPVVEEVTPDEVDDDTDSEEVTPDADAEGEEPEAAEETEQSADYWRGRAEALEEALKAGRDEPGDDEPSEEETMQSDIRKLQDDLAAMDAKVDEDSEAEEIARAALDRQKIAEQITQKRLDLSEARAEARDRQVSVRESERQYVPMVNKALKDADLPEAAYNQLHEASSTHLRSKGFGPNRPPSDSEVADSLELVAGRIAKARKSGVPARRGVKVAPPATGTRRGAPAKTGLAAITTGKDASEEKVLEDMRKQGLIP